MRNEQLRTCMFYDFRRELKATESYEKMKKGLVSDYPSFSTLAKNFLQFSRGNFSVNDDSREGRQKTVTHEENEATVLPISRILKEKLR